MICSLYVGPQSEIVACYLIFVGLDLNDSKTPVTFKKKEFS